MIFGLVTVLVGIVVSVAVCGVFVAVGGVDVLLLLKLT